MPVFGIEAELGIMASKRQRLYLASLHKEETYEKLVAEWGAEECWICGSTPKKRRLHVDHNHSPDLYVRGLLCFNCNKRLDERVTPRWLRDAAEYLENANARYRDLIAGKRVA